MKKINHTDFQLTFFMDYFEWHSKDNRKIWRNFIQKFIGENIFATANNLGISKFSLLKFLIKFYWQRMKKDDII